MISLITELALENYRFVIELVNPITENKQRWPYDLNIEQVYRLEGPQEMEEVHFQLGEIR